MSTSLGKRAAGIAIGAFLAVIALDLAVWAAHVRWRNAALEELNPVVEQIEVLAGHLSEDDDWLQRNSRLAQQYAEHRQYTGRLEARGRRQTAHDALVDAYNEQLGRLYARFYVALTPAPDPPLREHWAP